MHTCCCLGECTDTEDHKVAAHSQVPVRLSPYKLHGAGVGSPLITSTLSSRGRRTGDRNATEVTEGKDTPPHHRQGRTKKEDTQISMASSHYVKIATPWHGWARAHPFLLQETINITTAIHQLTFMQCPSHKACITKVGAQRETITSTLENCPKTGDKEACRWPVSTGVSCSTPAQRELPITHCGVRMNRRALNFVWINGHVLPKKYCTFDRANRKSRTIRISEYTGPN